MWIDVDKTLDALLPHVGPTISTHPFSFAQRALELTKTALFTLVRSEAFPFRSGLKQKQTT